MARVIIELPEQFNYSTELQVQFSNVNMGKHLGAEQILPLVIEAQMRFLRDLGYLSDDINIEGLSLIMADSATIYKAQAFYGETLLIEVRVRDFSKYSCDFVYRMTNKATRAEIARVKTGMMFFDYEKQKPHPVPDEFRRKIAVAVI